MDKGLPENLPVTNFYQKLNGRGQRNVLEKNTMERRNFSEF